MSLVLVDTSVWRRYLAGSLAVRGLGDLLDEDAVLAHPFVLGELILGGLSAREEALLSHLSLAPLLAHSEVMEFVRRRRLTRRGIGWVDAHLLASGLTIPATLWSLDRKLATAADSLGIVFAGVDSDR